MSKETYSVFILQGHRDAGEGNLGGFPGAVLITPEPMDYRYVSGAWNYAIRQTSSAFLTVHYDKALDFLREKHPDWIITQPEKPREIYFKTGSPDIQFYTPPD